MYEEGLVSIIIPVYNSEKYLRQCVDSVLRQTYEKIEIILVDDGSKDSSPAICDEYQERDSRIKVIHQVNSGPSAARNAGIDNATGEYLSFVDNDDMIHPKFIEMLYSICKKENCDVGLSRVRTFFEDEEALKYDVGEQSYTYFSRDELTEKLLDMGWNGISVLMAKIFRAEIFNNHRFHVDRIIGDDDSSTYLLYWNTTKNVLVSEPIYYYRSQRKGSITHTKYDPSWMVGMDAFRERMEFFKEHGNSILYAKAMRGYCRKISENYVKMKHFYPEKTDICRELKSRARKVSFHMFFLGEIPLKQRMSAIILAWFPRLWNKVKQGK